MLTIKLHGGFRARDFQGREISITSRKAKALLAYLASPLGRPRSRETIMALLWSDRGDEQARGSLRQALASLRRDLGEQAAKAIITTHDDVALDPDHVALERPLPGEEFLEGLHINDPAFDEWLRDERLRLEDDLQCETKQKATAFPEKPSIAVLPFANLSNDPDQEYFADGITEDVTTELSRFGSLRVLARHSTFVLRDRAENVRERIEALGADYLLEGSIRRAGEQIRLTAQLVEVASEKNVWAHRYDRKLSEVFVIQDELVHAIVATLVGRLEASGLERALRKPPESLVAYDYYLQGLWYDRKYDPRCSADGVAVLEKAVALDPTFARAYGLLATSMMISGWHASILQVASAECLSIAKKAVELDPTDGDCFAKLGMVHLDRREHEEARRNLEWAMVLNPHEPSTWSHYAWYLVAVGEPEKALEYLDRREAIDPYPPNWNADIRAEALYDLGSYSEAAYVLEQKAVPYHYNYGQLAACYGQLGRKEEAAECWARYIDANPQATIASVGEVNAYKHQTDLDHWTNGLLKAGLGD